MAATAPTIDVRGALPDSSLRTRSQRVDPDTYSVRRGAIAQVREVAGLWAWITSGGIPSTDGGGGHRRNEAEREGNQVGDDTNLASPPAEMRSRAFWRLVAYAAILGVIGAVTGIVFLGVTGIGATWYGTTDLGWFEGQAWWIGVAAITGLAVGLLRRMPGTPQKAAGLVEDLRNEEVDLKAVPPIVAISAVSIFGGASLGPEIALGQVGGGAAGWIARRRGMVEDEAKPLTLSGMAGAYGGLFSSPLVALALVMEIARPPRARIDRTFFTSLVSSSISFALYFAVIGSVFLGAYAVPAYQFEDWHLVAGVGLGILGALLAVVTAAVVMAAVRIFARLPVGNVAKPVIGGLVFGLVGFALPLTLFTGSTQLEAVIANAGTLGVGLLVAILLGKMVAFAVSMASGFIGGPIFPVLFLGGTAGVIVNQVAPDVPLGLAFSCMLAAVPGAIVPAPFTLVLLAVLLTQVGTLQTAPVLIAVGTASLIVAGVRSIRADRASAASAPAGEPG